MAIVAGKGNNGGDGFVIARYLLNRGVSVKVFLLTDSEGPPGRCRDQFSNLPSYERGSNLCSLLEGLPESEKGYGEV